MAVSLDKAGTKLVNANGTPVSEIEFGFGWTATSGGKKGLAGKWARMKGVDLDGVAMLFNASGGIIGACNWDNMNPMGGALTHTGDNRTGKGDGYDETIVGHLDRLPAQVHSVVFAITAFKRSDDFRKISEANFGVIDRETGNPVTENFLEIMSTDNAALLARVDRDGLGWKAFAMVTDQDEPLLTRVSGWTGLVEFAKSKMSDRRS